MPRNDTPPVVIWKLKPIADAMTRARMHFPPMPRGASLHLLPDGRLAVAIFNWKGIRR